MYNIKITILHYIKLYYIILHYMKLDILYILYYLNNFVYYNKYYLFNFYIYFFEHCTIYLRLCSNYII